MALNNFFILAPPLKNISGVEHKIKKSSTTLPRQLLRKNEALENVQRNELRSVQQDEASSYKKQCDE